MQSLKRIIPPVVVCLFLVFTTAWSQDATETDTTEATDQTTNAEAEQESASSTSEEDDIVFESLRAPESPGFSLLGIAPTEVKRPGTPDEIVLTVSEASNKFTTIPQNVAVEFSPYWIGWGTQIKYVDYTSPEKNVWQAARETFTISAAMTSQSPFVPDSTTSFGLGIRFSLLQGRVKPEFSPDGDRIHRVVTALDQIANRKATMIAELITDGVNSDEAEERVDSMFALQNDSAVAALSSVLRSEGWSLTQLRYGLKIDFAAALVFDFPQNQNPARGDSLTRFGAWMTVGYEWEQRESCTPEFYFMLRGIYDRRDISQRSADGGFRLIFGTRSKFTLSGELLARYFWERDNSKLKWRYSGSLDYVTDSMGTVQLTLGRDMTGRRTGNAIAILSLLKSFGSNSTSPPTAESIRQQN